MDFVMRRCKNSKCQLNHAHLLKLVRCNCCMHDLFDLCWNESDCSRKHVCKCKDDIWDLLIPLIEGEDDDSNDKNRKQGGCPKKGENIPNPKANSTKIGFKWTQKKLNSFKQTSKNSNSISPAQHKKG